MWVDWDHLGALFVMCGCSQITLQAGVIWRFDSASGMSKKSLFPFPRESQILSTWLLQLVSPVGQLEFLAHGSRKCKSRSYEASLRHRPQTGIVPLCHILVVKEIHIGSAQIHQGANLYKGVNNTRRRNLLGNIFRD